MKKKGKEPINIGEFEVLDTSALLNDINVLCGTGEEPQIPGAEAEITDFVYSDDWMAHHGFWEEQIREIQKGHDNHLAVERYAKDCYNWMQMREIRLGLQEKLHTGIYEDPLYTADQMREIRLGMMEGINVDKYAKLTYSIKEMKKIHKKLLEEAYSIQPHGYAKTIEDEESGIRIRITDNCMEAYITFTEKPEYTPGEVRNILEKNGLEYGILDKALEEIIGQNYWNREFIIAKGKMARQGEDGRFEFFFNPLLPGKPMEMEDGSVDYTQVAEVDRVLGGKPIARYHAAKPGENGMTVTGIPITGKAGKEYPPLTGQGFQRNPADNVYTATMDGFAFADAQAGTLNVWNIFVVNGDVNRYNGHITYDGIIHICGNVEDMAVIEASGNIVVEGIVEGAATLNAGKNVILKNGVTGGERGIIKAGGRVMGKFFEAVKITAGGDVEGNYFMNCVIKTDGRLIAKGRKGRILGGHMQALGGIEAVSIGNQNLTRTVLDVGDAQETEERRKDALFKLRKVENELFQLELGKAKLVQILGEDLARQNPLYLKTDTAVKAIEAQKQELENYIGFMDHLVKRAASAEIIVHGTLQEGVRVIMNGKNKDIPPSSGGKIIIRRDAKRR